MSFMIAALAIFRVAHLIAKENGPFDVFLQLRDITMMRYGRFHWLTEGIHCPVCVAFWLAWLVPFVPVWIQFGLALSVIPLLLVVFINALNRLGVTCAEPEESDDERATT